MELVDYVDFEQFEDKKGSISTKSIIQKLRDDGYLEYGKKIPREYIFEMFGHTKDDHDAHSFALLRLMSILMDNNFFSTSRDQHRGLYILQPREMAEYVARRNKSNYDQLRQRLRVLGSVPLHIMEENDRKRNEFEFYRSSKLLAQVEPSIKEKYKKSVVE